MWYPHRTSVGYFDFSKIKGRHIPCTYLFWWTYAHRGSSPSVTKSTAPRGRALAHELFCVSTPPPERTFHFPPPPDPQILSRPTLVPHPDALALDPKSSLAASPALEQLAADAACPCCPCASASAPTRAPLPQIGPKSTLGLGPCASASLPPGLPSPACCRAIEMTKDRAEAHSESSSTATASSGGLPLVPCPKCHTQMIWAVSGSSKNQGKEYFKCPRNDGMYSGRCDTFMWKDQYMSHLSRLRLVEQQRRDHSPVKLSNGNEVVFTVDHRVLDHLDAMKTSLDQMNNSVRKSTDGDEKLKMVLVAFLFLLLGICIAQIVN